MGTISPDHARTLVDKIRSLSGVRQRALIALLRQQGVDLSALDLMTPSPRPADEPVPLSFTQQRLWFLAQLDGTSAAYNIPMAVRLRGRLDRSALVRALEAVVQRHEALRTRFVDRDGVPYQHIGDGRDFAVRPEELADPADLPRICAEEAAAPFDLERDPLFRARLLRESEQEHVLLVTMHHGVSDGWSVGVLFRDLVALYEAFCEGRPSPLEPLPVQYADYTLWQRQWLADGVRTRQVEYWKKQLTGVDPRLSLPTDRERPPVKTYRGAREVFRCPAELLERLRTVGARYDATLYMTLLAAYTVVLHRYTQQNDIAVGTVVANRNRSEVEGLIGFFANTLVMRADLSDDPAFGDLLTQVRRTAVAAYDHQDVPFESVVDALQMERSLAHSPVFQTMFVLQEAQTGREERLGELQVLPVEFDVDVTKFDVTVDLRETPDGLVGTVEYNTDLYDPETIRRLVGHYTTLLAAVAADPQEKVSRLAFPAVERRRVLVEWNEGPAGWVAPGRCVHEWFEDVAAVRADAVAVRCEGRSLSYADVNARANRLADYLRELGVGRDVLVAVCLPRSEHMVVSLLAVLKAGGAYVPLDPAVPVERLGHVLRDSAPRVLLVDGGVPEGLDAAGVPVVDVRADAGLWEGRPAGDLPRGGGGSSVSDLAYVIYTSGSTGVPKGVMVEHRNVTRLFAATDEWFRFGADDVWTLFHSFAFDFSVWEIWGALLHGGRLVVVPQEVTRNPEEFYGVLCAEGVTVLNQTPSAFRQLIAAQGDGGAAHRLRVVVFGGEALDVSALRPWVRRGVNRDTRLVNMYGITETTVHVTYRELSSGDLEGSASPIGCRIPDLRLYVLDGRGGPVPVGAVGELYVGGGGVARGYLNRVELTGERFLPDPFCGDESARMYRSGDLVRQLPDGSLEYVGRDDDQVKIRGFRIELGEIENTLTQHEAVRSCVVVAREDGPGEKRLVAYVVLEDGHTAPDPRTELAQHLGRTLPEYMVPTAFVILDDLPLTANGKLDRKALPAPRIDAYAQREYVAPSTETERALAAVWAELLSFDESQVGADDNFFQMGGHSLLITVLVARLKEQGFDVPVRSVFSSPTLATLAAEIDGSTGSPAYELPPNLIPHGCERVTPEMLSLVDLDQDQIDAVVATVPGGAPNVQDLYPLASAQEGILFHHLLDPDSDPYLVSILLVADDEAACARFTRALQKLIDRHDVLRTAVLTAELPEPVQVVQRTARLEVERTLLDRDRDAEEQARALLARPRRMRVDEAPLLRLLIAEDPDSGRRYLLLSAHHLIEDASTLRLVLEELAVHMADRPELLASAPPYRDFVGHTLYQTATDDAEAHFRAALGDVTESTTPFGLTNVRGDGHEYPHLRRSLPDGLTQEVRAQAQRLRISPACLFHAAWACVVAAAAGGDDVVFGTVMSGRLQGVPGVERMLGNFINTLPLRVRLAGKTVRGLIEEVDGGLQGLIAREQSPLSLAQRCSGLEGDTPLFSSVINFRHFEPRHGEASLSLEEQGVHWLGETDAINYPLTVSLDDFGSELSLDLRADGAVACEAVADYVETALTGIVSALATNDGAGTLALDVDVLPAVERRRVLVEWNEGPAGWVAPGRCVHEWFEDVAAVRADAVAVRCEGRSLSYADVNARANRLADYLRELGVGRDVLVAVCLPRSEHMVVSLLAVLKAGGAYVPLDPAVPVERLGHVLRDSAPRVLLVDGGVPEGLDAAGVPVVDVRADAGLWEGRPAGDLPRGGGGSSVSDLAYVIYTSGSTGVPKGVMVEHRNVTRLFAATDEWFRFGADDVWTLFHSFAFDFSVWEIWGALLHGGRLVVVPQEVTRNPEEFYGVLCAEGVTVLNQTPSAFRQLIAAQGDGGAAHRLRVVVFGGEALDVSALRPWVRRGVNRDTRLVNMYGITETTVHVTYRELSSGDLEGSASPIGCRIPDLRLYVLDGRGGPVPVGAVGELYVGGGGVARGYLNRVELTGERFLPDPFCGDESARMYRSGDLVRQLPDGSLEYVGRDDDQVKIRGFRIELGEIENTLTQHEAVRQGVVLARESGDTRALVAYVHPTPEWFDSAAREQNAHLLDQWQRVFEDQYTGSQDEHTPDDLNLAGWDSSYTGEPIPRAEMREWIDGTVQRIEELRPTRLLEIGCGTGLLLFRYAELCESVHALDLSPSALSDVRRGVSQRGWTHVTLEHGDALSVADLAEGTFDTIVLNSVAQYFPNRLYLEDAISRMLPLLEDGGRILIGDVRNLDLLPAHLGAVERSRSDVGTTAGELSRQVRYRRRQESELLLSPTYFAQLPERFSVLGAVDIVAKRGVGDNEMTAYRYDVILTKGTATPTEPLPWLEAGTPQRLRDLLDEGGTADRFGVSGLRNPRIADDVRISDGLARWSPAHEVEPLPKGSRLTARAAEEVRELEAVLLHAETLGYQVAATWSQDRPDALDLVFGKGGLPRVRARAPYRAQHLANFPRIGDLGPSMARTLKEHLSARLPSYMVPGVFVLLEDLPVTPNGKVDKRALPAPDEDAVAKEAYIAPRTGAERILCRILGEMLGLSRVGIADTFFALGGHSLLAVRLNLRVKQETGTELPLQLILTGATVADMAAAIETEPAAAEVVPLVPAVPSRDGEEAPLSLQQRDLWFLNHPQHLEASWDNAQLAYRLEGRLDREAFGRAVRALAERHPVLRTGYVHRDGTLTQRVNDASGFEMKVSAPISGDAALREWLAQERTRPFAPDGRHMVRIHLVPVADDEHVFVLTRPWGVFDGWSLTIVLPELMALYRALVRGTEAVLPPLPLRYADFARWQRRVVGAGELDRQLAYWRGQLDGLPALLSLHTDRPRGPVQSYRGAKVGIDAPMEVLTRLQQLSQESGGTLYMTLLAAFAVLVGRYSDDQELAIGTPVTNRPKAELEPLVGYFVNTLVIRLDVTPDRGFSDLLKQTRHVTAEAHECKDLPFVDLARELVPNPDPAYSPLFQVMFNLVPMPRLTADEDGLDDGLATEPVEADPGPAKYDLNLTVRETDAGLVGHLEYSTDLFTEETAARMARSYERLLREIAADPDADLTRLRARSNGAA